MDIEPKKEQQLIDQATIDELTRTVLKLPQADCPVAHYFGPGTYIRQVTFPAGIFAIGHKQRFEQMNIFVQGRVAMIQPDGTTKEMVAPMIFMGPPGQKMGVILETVTWLNVYPNPDDERDIDILEERFLDRDGPWTEKEESEKQQRYDDRQEDRDDYQKFLEEVEAEDKEIRNGDFIDMPDGFGSVLNVRASDIAGRGIFTSWPFQKNSMIGPMQIENKWTLLGRYVNHSKRPNASLSEMPNGDIILIAKREISGCRGGDKGEEITIDYREVYT